MAKDTTGNTARAMAAAPLADSQAVAPVEPIKADTKPADNGKMPLPSPVFAMVANVKTYPDRQDASKSNSKIAEVALTQGPFTVTGSIYLETKITQTADGRHEQKTIAFSLPKGVKMRDIIDNERINDWKDTVIDAFIAYRKASGSDVAVAPKTRAGVRAL